MLRTLNLKTLSALVLSILFSITVSAQVNSPAAYKSQEMDEAKGVPVLMEHLPNWEEERSKAAFAKSVPELKAALGERPVLDLIDFAGGTEAVTAPYDAGKLLIIEYTSPQASVDADTRILSAIAGDPTIDYRRIGNYNVLLFDVADRSDAEALIDQVHYEKQIQWLGNNPFRISAERAFVITTSDVFLTTVLVIVLGIGFSLVGGLACGFLYFIYRERQRAGSAAFSDAGGMTRLNLDGFTPDISNRLLKG